MSRPLGSECCDNTVTLVSEPGERDRFTCDDCGQECEVVL
jgi:hypothetical protein